LIDTTLALWCVAGALLAGLIVFAVTAKTRRALREQVVAAHAALAVAESRLSDLGSQHGSLNESHRLLGDRHLSVSQEKERIAAEKEHLAANLDDLNLRLVQIEREVREAAEVNRKQSEEIADFKAQGRVWLTERGNYEDKLRQQQLWIEDQTRKFEAEISNITNRLLEEKAKAFTELNKREMDTLVAPFKDQLNEFRNRVDSIYAEDTKDRGQLREQVEQLARLNSTVSQRAEELTRALTISSKATGDWGEVVLQRILEASNLRPDQDYVLQETVSAAVGDERQRPDAVVYLPQNRQVVIDAKVSNKAWTHYCNATDEAERKARLQDHLGSLRAHIRGLSARNYPGSPDLRTVDFVLMFVPVEAALLTALAHDENLYTEAFRSKIVLVTPSTLMAVLKLIEGMWSYQRRKESADEIADAGRKLYEKLVTFSETFLEVGATLDKAQEAYAKARGQLSSGRGNAIGLAERMRNLGVNPAKQLPPRLTDLSGAEDDGGDPVRD